MIICWTIKNDELVRIPTEKGYFLSTMAMPDGKYMDWGEIKDAFSTMNYLVELDDSGKFKSATLMRFHSDIPYCTKGGKHSPGRVIATNGNTNGTWLTRICDKCGCSYEDR